MTDENQTTKCEATGQIIATRFSRFTTDGHLVSVNIYNKVGMELMNFNLTLQDITNTLLKLEYYHTLVRKAVLWTLEGNNIEGKNAQEKIDRLIAIQNNQTIEHYKKALHTIKRDEHFALLRTLPCKDMVWNSEALSQSAIVDAINYYTKYFSINTNYA